MSEFIFANIGIILGVVGGYFGRPWVDAFLGRLGAWIVGKLS